ncbi:MAG: hypothetical protein HQL52_08680 [Magnetococcales bacterium]|nr:hypothetical protein [Magnetococcales bacterium]
MKEEKNFDAVKFQRERRAQISQDMQGMTFEEINQYIEANLSEEGKKLLKNQAPSPWNRTHDAA